MCGRTCRCFDVRSVARAARTAPWITQRICNPMNRAEFIQNGATRMGSATKSCIVCSADPLANPSDTHGNAFGNDSGKTKKEEYKKEKGERRAAETRGAGENDERGGLRKLGTASVVGPRPETVEAAERLHRGTKPCWLTQRRFESPASMPPCLRTPSASQTNRSFRARVLVP